jgi:sporulation protein YlmC with PRC-barrel domain
MDIPVGAKVNCTDGPCGQSSHILINPISQTITHVVVYDSHWLSSTSRMVPFEQILETTPDTIRLGCSRDDVLKMDDFIKVHYLENAFYDADLAAINHPMLAHSWWPGDSEAYMLWPYVTPDEASPYISIPQEQIPPGEMAVCRGTEVWATDGAIGQVDEFMVDPISGHITHLVLREGHLWGQRDISIPIASIQQMGKYRVELKVDKQAIAALPHIPVRRFHQVTH